VLWRDLTQTKKILDEGDERSIQIHFSCDGAFNEGLLLFGLVFFAFDISFFDFLAEGGYFNPLFPLFAAMKLLFIDEYKLFLLEQKTGGSKLADVFS